GAPRVPRHHAPVRQREPCPAQRGHARGQGARRGAGAPRRRAAGPARARPVAVGHSAARFGARGPGARAAQPGPPAGGRARQRDRRFLPLRRRCMSTLALPLHLVRPQAERKPVNKWLVTVSVSFGTLMGAIDASIVNVALTHIRGSVGASLQEITWISTGFVVATVLVMPLTAFLGRLVGQKRLYM